jgi:hypothetical protein
MDRGKVDLPVLILLGFPVGMSLLLFTAVQLFKKHQ